MARGWTKQTLAIVTLTTLWWAVLWYAAIMTSYGSTGRLALNNPAEGGNFAEDEIELHMRGPLQPDDPLLVNRIREMYLVPPSDLPYNFRYKEEFRNAYISAKLIDSIVRDFFGSKQDGFFVEAGALDGEYMSHTLDLERKQGWRGMLVEPDELNFAALKERHRKAWISPTCLSTHDYPERVVLKRVAEPSSGTASLNQGTGRIMKANEMDDPDALYNSLFTPGQCVPLQSLLTSINVSHVDFFVLDVEKVEREVLENFPFDKITVDMWAIEHSMFYEDREFVKFMQSKGYYYFDILCLEVADYIFLRKGSELYSSLHVPVSAENRTEVCAYKEFRGNQNLSSHEIDLRDLHHFPELMYKEVPRIAPPSDEPYMVYRIVYEKNG